MSVNTIKQQLRDSLRSMRIAEWINNHTEYQKHRNFVLNNFKRRHM